MTTLTLQVENQTILKHLKAVLKAIDGVKVLSMTDNHTEKELSDEEVPNAETRKAMHDAEKGKDSIVRMDSLQSFMSSMMQE